jgi:heparan-alpha-glucosaminide N-acetyltransferase
MGGYELVRSDEAPALAVDLEAGAPRHGDHYPNGRVSKQAASPSPAPARQRLVSLDVFRGITVLVRTHNTHHSLLSARA